MGQMPHKADNYTNNLEVALAHYTHKGHFLGKGKLVILLQQKGMS